MDFLIKISNFMVTDRFFSSKWYPYVIVDMMSSYNTFGEKCSHYLIFS